MKVELIYPEREVGRRLHLFFPQFFWWRRWSKQGGGMVDYPRGAIVEAIVQARDNPIWDYWALWSFSRSPSARGKR